MRGERGGDTAVRLIVTDDNGRHERPFCFVHSLEPFKSAWMPKEVELEKYLLPHKDSDEPVLEPSAFGEPLLLISKVVWMAKMT